MCDIVTVVYLTILPSTHYICNENCINIEGGLFELVCMKRNKKLLAYAVLCVLYLGWAMSQISEKVVITDVEAETEIKEKYRIALTFDDGPSVYTESLLDGLKERDVQVSFFIVGQNAEKFPDTVKRAYEDGHLIGNHTYHHVDVAKISNDRAKEEVQKTNEVLEQITDEKPEYMRPPFGSWQKELELEVGMLPVMWSIDPLDWTTKNVSQIVNNIVTDAEENDIILMHDCYESSVEAALQVIDILREAGFEFVTVDELLMP